MNDLSSRFIVKFAFVEPRFEYTLPITTVDLDYLRDRRAETESCMKQLAAKITEINIASREGVADFSTADALVRYYFYAMKRIESRAQSILNVGKATPEMSEAYQSQMAKWFKEKTL